MYSGNRGMKFVRAGVSAVLCMSLAACAVFKPKAPPDCPTVLVLKEAADLSRFKPGPGRDITDQLFGGKLIDFKGDCGYDKKGVDLNLLVKFEITRGPALSDRVARFSFFVAIPKFHPSSAGKRVFPVAVEFPTNRTRIRYADEIEIKIPLPPGPRKIDDLEVFLGFQLSPDELIFNRRKLGKRR